MNTYEVITRSYPPGYVLDPKTGGQKQSGFRSDNFNTYFYQNIAAGNYYSIEALESDVNLAPAAVQLKRKDVMDAMLQEHTLVKAVSDEWCVRLEPERKLQSDLRKRQNAANKPPKARR
jgi:hypothetical protein